MRSLRTRLRSVVQQSERRYRGIVVRRASQRPAVPVDAGAVAHEVSSSRTRLERLLLENVVPFWCERVIADTGGYHLNHDRAGRSLEAVPKQLCGQARVLWFFSRLSRTQWGSPEHVEAARHGYRFLTDRMWDATWGGFYWEVSPTGDPTKTHKELVAQAYGLFALAEFARATGDVEAKALVADLWCLLERHCHDDRHGGYIELRRVDWSPADDLVGYYTRDPLAKALGVQLHVLEALTTYVDARIGADAGADERLLEMILLLAMSTAGTSERSGHEQLGSDWSPDGRARRQRYGHDAELVWMLHDGWRALARPMTPLVPLFRERFDEILRRGYDGRNGGFYTEGPAGGYADDTAKEYWTQAEGLLAAFRLYTLTGDVRYGDCYLRTLHWIETRQADWVGGDWYERIDKRGRPTGVKASTWKEPYHQGRALIECIESLDVSRLHTLDG